MVRCMGLNLGWWNDTHGVQEPAMRSFFHPDPHDCDYERRTYHCLNSQRLNHPSPHVDVCERAYESFRCYYEQYGNIVVTPQFVPLSDLQQVDVLLQCANMLPLTVGRSCAGGSKPSERDVDCLARCFLLRSGLYSEQHGPHLDRLYVQCNNYANETRFRETTGTCYRRLKSECQDECVLAALVERARLNLVAVADGLAEESLGSVDEHGVEQVLQTTRLAEAVLERISTAGHERVEEAQRLLAAREASSSKALQGGLRDSQHTEQIVGDLQILKVGVDHELRALAQGTVVLVVALERLVHLGAEVIVAGVQVLRQTRFRALDVVEVIRVRHEMSGNHVLLQTGGVVPEAQVEGNATQQTANLLHIGVAFLDVAQQIVIVNALVLGALSLCLVEALLHDVVLQTGRHRDGAYRQHEDRNILEHSQEVLVQISVAEALAENVSGVLAPGLVTGQLVQVGEADVSLGVVLLEGILLGLSVQVVQERSILGPGTEASHVREEEALRLRSAWEASSSQLAAGVLRHIQHVEQVVGQLQILTVVARDVLGAGGERSIVLVVALEGTVGLHARLAVALLRQVHQTTLSTLGIVAVLRGRDEVVSKHVLVERTVLPCAQVLQDAQHQTVDLWLVRVSFTHVALQTIVRHLQVDGALSLSLREALPNEVVRKRRMLSLDGANDGNQGDGRHNGLAEESLGSVDEHGVEQVLQTTRLAEAVLERIPSVFLALCVTLCKRAVVAHGNKWCCSAQTR
uniref:Uncharacterized protein n=1 Tax=Anopheles coluzzii TaxID=1518534 RepID=A0A8W7PS21_ANOCL